MGALFFVIERDDDGQTIGPEVGDLFRVAESDGEGEGRVLYIVSRIEEHADRIVVHVISEPEHDDDDDA